MLWNRPVDRHSAGGHDDSDETVPGGTVLAVAAIGIAPTVAAVGTMAGVGHFAVAAAASLLLAGVVAAVLSSDS
jgi:hypothetical protein